MKTRLPVPGILFVLMSIASVPSTVSAQALFAGVKGGLRDIQTDPKNGKNNTGSFVVAVGYELKI